MCGRKTLTKGKRKILEELSIDEWEEGFEWFPHFNIAPTHTTPVLIRDSLNRVVPMRWGLIPHWAKDMKIGAKMINARAETLTEKPSFRSLVDRRRCIVISDGYYEWQRVGDQKIPFHIHSPGFSIMPMAGLWDSWTSPEGQIIKTYTVITTTPAKSIAHLHFRMPVILPRDKIDPWLDSGKTPKQKAVEFLQPYQGELEYYRVSMSVNSPSFNFPTCIDPIL